MTTGAEKAWLSEYTSLRTDSRDGRLPKDVRDDATWRLLEHVRGANVPLRHLQWAKSHILSSPGGNTAERMERQRLLVNAGPGMGLAKAFRRSKDDPLNPGPAEDGMVALVACAAWWRERGWEVGEAALAEMLRRWPNVLARAVMES